MAPRPSVKDHTVYLNPYETRNPRTPTATYSSRPTGPSIWAQTSSLEAQRRGAERLLQTQISEDALHGVAGIASLGLWD